jgi:hypothetical protein
MATAIKIVPQKLTCSDIAKSAEFLRLPKRMQKWAVVYIQGYIDSGTFDYLAATKAAYKPKNITNARSWGCQIKKHPKMLEVLTLFMNSSKTALELKLEDLQRQLDAAEPGSTAATKFWAWKEETEAKIEAQAAKVIEQSTPPPPGPPQPLEVAASAPAAPTAPHRFKVGETCIVNGKPYRVTKVDENGNALAGEPL